MGYIDRTACCSKPKWDPEQFCCQSNVNESTWFTGACLSVCPSVTMFS